MKSVCALWNEPERDETQSVAWERECDMMNLLMVIRDDMPSIDIYFSAWCVYVASHPEIA
jgi:hypothetical protein